MSASAELFISLVSSRARLAVLQYRADRCARTRGRSEISDRPSGNFPASLSRQLPALELKSLILVIQPRAFYSYDRPARKIGDNSAAAAPVDRRSGIVPHFSGRAKGPSKTNRAGRKKRGRERVGEEAKNGTSSGSPSQGRPQPDRRPH